MPSLVMRDLLSSVLGLSVAGCAAGLVILALSPPTAQAAPLDPLTLLPIGIVRVQGPVAVDTAAGDGIFTFHSAAVVFTRPTAPIPLDKVSILRKGGGVPVAVGSQASSVRLAVETHGADLFDAFGKVLITSSNFVVVPPAGIRGRTITLSPSGPLSPTGGTIFGTGVVEPQAKLSVISGASMSTGISAAPDPVPLPPGIVLFASGLLPLGLGAYRRSHSSPRSSPGVRAFF